MESRTISQHFTTPRGLATEEDGERVFEAILVAEPDNEYDRDAVAVYSAAGKLGYVPRGDARAYAPVFRKIDRQGFRARVCTGLLVGGTPTSPTSESSSGSRTQTLASANSSTRSDSKREASPQRMYAVRARGVRRGAAYLLRSQPRGEC
jgi:hypothetical protein